MSIRKVSISQVKAARALLGWSQEDLAEAAKISTPTVKRLEAKDGLLGGRQETGEKLVAAIEAKGVEFINEADGSFGVRLRARARKGRR